LATVLDENSSVSVGRVDCVKYALGICHKYLILNSPTILWLENGKQTDRYRAGRSVKLIKEYIEGKLASKNNV
jgi:hypothetical protein